MSENLSEIEIINRFTINCTYIVSLKSGGEFKSFTGRKGKALSEDRAISTQILLSVDAEKGIFAQRQQLAGLVGKGDLREAGGVAPVADHRLCPDRVPHGDVAQEMEGALLGDIETAVRVDCGAGSGIAQGVKAPPWTRP